tara:strand:+ start:1392 stop:1853 length:462 start_codon:yes stop_codon:yes gene_type:complete
MADTSLSETKIGLLIWQVSNLWQSRLRKILKKYNLTLNEYLIIESSIKLGNNKSALYQNEISIYAGIDFSVSSVIFKLLEEKKIVSRVYTNDNRKKNIKVLSNGINLYKMISPLINDEEKKIFNKLQNENYNFTNSLKLLLGKRLRIKAKNYL